MFVSDAQRLGTVVVLLVILALYGIFLNQSGQPSHEMPIIWGEQKKGLLAVEIEDDRHDMGIYFLLPETTIEQIRESTGIKGITGKNGKLSLKAIGIDSGSSIVFAPGRDLKIGDIAAAKKLALGLPLDLNNATEEDIALVPGIGDKIAFQIIQLRNRVGQFRNYSDLMAVPGIKEKKLNAIKSYFLIKQ